MLDFPIGLNRRVLPFRFDAGAHELATATAVPAP
jgi:hypothetical protein